MRWRLPAALSLPSIVSSDPTQRFPRRHPCLERFAQISCLSNKRIMQDIAAEWLAYFASCSTHPRHCKRSEAIQSPTGERFWIASLRSQ
jgi:hypothetical protein